MNAIDSEIVVSFSHSHLRIPGWLLHIPTHMLVIRLPPLPMNTEVHDHSIPSSAVYQAANLPLPQKCSLITTEFPILFSRLIVYNLSICIRYYDIKLQRTIAMVTRAIPVVALVFALAPVVITHQAYAWPA